MQWKRVHLWHMLVHAIAGVLVLVTTARVLEAVSYTHLHDKKENIQFNCVIDPEADLKCINDFFIKEEALREYRVSVSYTHLDVYKRQ